MDESDKKELMKDYVAKFYKTYRILELTGFCRFVIRNGKVVERNLGTMIYNIFVLIFANICAAYLLGFGNEKEKYLSLVEYIAIMHFTIFSNLLILDITFGNKYRGSDMIQTSIEIDHLLGAKETEFMREVSIKFYLFLILLLRITQVIVVGYMFYIFKVSYGIHIAGTIYFNWLFFSYDDFCFFTYVCSFLTMRARYLNVALIKITKMKMNYIPKQLLFNKLFWKDEYNNRVTYHTRCSTEDYCVMYRMLYELLRQVEECYRFTLILGVVTVAVGSIVTVQSYIMYIKTAGTMLIRATVISGWSIASWFHVLLISLQIDLFYRQIEQTKLICAYIQLKPNTPPEILKLTKKIFKTLEVRNARVSLYDMSYFNTGFTFRIAASTFVYITVQLQLAFPNLKDVQKAASFAVNTTVCHPEFDYDPIKVKEFWFF